MLLSRRAQRMARHHARRAKANLNMVSLMDIFTILVFFLLFSSTEEVQVLPEPRDLDLPESLAELEARESALIIVSGEELRLDGVTVARLDEVLGEEAPGVPALAQAFAARLAAGEDLGTEITIMGERTLPYRLLKRIMSTCTAADFERIALAVRQRGAGELASGPSAASGPAG